MQFLLETDFRSLIKDGELNILTGGDNTLLTTTEQRAIDEMTGYLSVRYNTDTIFAQTEGDRNDLIVMYLCDIVLYHLHSRIAPDDIPEFRRDRYVGARDWLEKTADGFTNPVLPRVEEGESPLKYGNSSPKQNPYY